MHPDAEEFERIRRRTEALWAATSPNRGVTGYQMQRGTRWNPGLGRDEMDAYERALGLRFPASLRCMLSVMNGTDLPAINFFGSSGHPVRECAGVYAYPRNLALVRSMIADVQPDRTEIEDVLAEQGFRLEPGDGLVPIYSHRFLVCGADPLDSPVLSIQGTDAIVYGRSLAEYLGAEFLRDETTEQIP